MASDARLNSYMVAALPESLDKRLFTEALLRQQFAMYHELSSRRTFLMASAGIDVLLKALPGLEVEELQPETLAEGEVTCLVIAGPHDGADVIGNAYRLFGGLRAGILVVFTPMSHEAVISAKLKTERLLSDKETGLTESTSTRAEVMSQTSARHRDSYSDSEERDFLMSTLETLKSAALMNGRAHKIVVFLIGDYAKVEDYLSSKLAVLERKIVRQRSLEALCEAARSIDAMPFSYASAAKMVGFSNAIRINRAIGTAAPESAGEVSFGQVMEGSVKETGLSANASASSFNLGTLISGVPGTGKTFAAMHIVGQLAQMKGLKIAIISPTDEWNSFGRKSGLRVIRLLRSETQFNFFKCDSGIEIDRFYENLAMLLASASEAGPYTNSLEKCLLAAFRRVYAEDRAPDPVGVYEAIEDAIVEQHGKRSAVGVKYTKHGENSRSALENLRSMLNRPEFSKREGESFSELLERGVVFDLSGISNKMKPFYYALILNQVYSVADMLDTRGDGELRMLLCLEEAQTVFRQERNGSAATADLAERIQDFRKRGVGLLLITHNVTDIDPSIRRLCQTKLYFRQSSDIAKFAANDLLFGEGEKEELAERLKSLEQRVCALNYLQGRERACAAFAKLPEHEAGKQDEAPSKPTGDSSAIGKMTIKIADKGGAAKEGARIQVFYVGEKVYEGATDSQGSVEVSRTIKGNGYRLVVLGEKKKDSRVFGVVGGETNVIKL